MISLQRTVSSIFIVPLLGIRRERLQDEAIGFINGYLMDDEYDSNYDSKVLLAFQPKNLAVFNSFLLEERSREGSGLLDEYDYAGGLVVLVYPIPEAIEPYMDLLLNGKYSQFPDELKERYPKVVQIKDPRSGLRRDEMALAWRIFRKDADLRTYWEGILGQSLDKEMEVWSLPDMERETLKPNLFISDSPTTK